MISDVQVKFSDGRMRDMLRKLHDVGPYLVVGFAGSVMLGFQMVESLRAHLKLPAGAPPNACWIPAEVAETWHTKGADIFARASEVERGLGCALLLVGVHPREETLPDRARAYVIRMAAPHFKPGYTQRRIVSVLSIGSGSQIPSYRRIVRELFDLRRNPGLLQAEVGKTGGWGQTISHAIGMALDRDRQAGVSANMHYADVRLGRITIYNNNRTDYPGDGRKVEFRMPRVATDYPTFCAMAREQGVSEAQATC